MTAQQMRQCMGKMFAANPVLHQWAIGIDNWMRGSRVEVSGGSNEVSIRGVRMVKSKIRIEGSDNSLEIGPGTRLFSSLIYIRGNSHRVRIGRDCVLGQLNLNVQSQSTLVSVGDRSTSASVNMEVGEPNISLSIGQDCMISHDVEIMCSDSHSVVDLESGLRLNPAKDVEIGDHVWLGANTAVLKGSRIGRNCVIGFRSVVTGTLPPSSLCLGIPAQVTRTQIGWKRELI